MGKMHTQEKPFKCTECDKAYIDRNRLYTHLTNAHGINPWQCEECSLSFKLKRYLTKHQEAKHSSNSKDKKRKLDEKNNKNRPLKRRRKEEKKQLRQIENAVTNAPTLHCLYQQELEKSKSMIQCTECTQWYDRECEGLDENERNDGLGYTCTKCIRFHNKKTLEQEEEHSRNGRLFNHRL